MKNLLLYVIAIALMLLFANTLSAQSKQDFGFYYLADKQYYTNSQEGPFNSIIELEKHYRDKSKRYQKTANTLGGASLTMMGLGFLMAIIPGSGCEFICGHQAVGILLFIASPVPGILGIVVQGQAIKNRKRARTLTSLSYGSQLPVTKPDFSIAFGQTPHGLGLIVTF